MPQTNLGIYLSIVTYLIVILSILYIYLKIKIIPTIKNKIKLRSLFPGKACLICKKSSGTHIYPIFFK